MKNKIYAAIAILIMLFFSACGKQESVTDYYDAPQETPALQETEKTDEANITQQPEQIQKAGIYKGILTEYYGFGRMKAADFEKKYGADNVIDGERTTVIILNKDRFEFNGNGLFYAGIESDTFTGPAGIHCGMTLNKAVETLLPEYSASFDYENDEFQSIFGQSYYDEYLGINLISPYCVFYRLGVEDATEEGAYVLKYSVKSDYGTEEINLFFSTEKILTAYSMQLV